MVLFHNSMYRCIVRVRHISLVGEAYTRAHVVVVRQTLDDAVRSCGAVPPAGAVARLHVTDQATYIVYPGGVLPVGEDPRAVVFDVGAMPGGLLVPVPYQCTESHFIDYVVPDRLRRLGAHPFDVRGTLSDSMYGGGDVPLRQWLKLGRPVTLRWPWRAVQAVRALQAAWRAQKEDDWCVLQQGFEPWTNSS